MKKAVGATTIVLAVFLAAIAVIGVLNRSNTVTSVASEDVSDGQVEPEVHSRDTDSPYGNSFGIARPAEAIVIAQVVALTGPEMSLDRHGAPSWDVAESDAAAEEGGDSSVILPGATVRITEIVAPPTAYEFTSGQTAHIINPAGYLTPGNTYALFLGPSAIPGDDRT